MKKKGNGRRNKEGRDKGKERRKDEGKGVRRRGE